MNRYIVHFNWSYAENQQLNSLVWGLRSETETSLEDVLCIFANAIFETLKETLESVKENSWRRSREYKNYTTSQEYLDATPWDRRNWFEKNSALWLERNPWVENNFWDDMCDEEYLADEITDIFSNNLDGFSENFSFLWEHAPHGYGHTAWLNSFKDEPLVILEVEENAEDKLAERVMNRIKEYLTPKN